VIDAIHKVSNKIVILLIMIGFWLIMAAIIRKNQICSIFYIFDQIKLCIVMNVSIGKSDV